MDPDQTPIGAVCSGSTLFASILNSSVMLGNYLQQTTSADDIFRCIFFLDPLRANTKSCSPLRANTKSCSLQISCSGCHSFEMYFSIPGRGFLEKP